MSPQRSSAARRDSVDDPSAESGPGAPTRRSVRLDGELLEQANAASRTAHRSVPHQIEFWAALGRAIEERLSAAETRDLLTGERFVTRVELATTRSIQPDQVFATLEAERASGALAARIPRSATRYDSAGANEGFVRRVDADGTESFGRHEDGTWCPQDDPP